MDDMKDNNLPDFIIIPGILLTCEELTPLDCHVFGIVYWYSRMQNKKCIASNATIGKLLKADPKSVSNSLSRLNKNGFVKIVLDENHRRKEIISLVSLDRHPSNNGGGIHQIMEGPPLDNGYNSISNNETSTNNRDTEYKDNVKILNYPLISNSDIDNKEVRESEDNGAIQTAEIDRPIVLDRKEPIVKGYSQSGYLLGLPLEDLEEFKAKFKLTHGEISYQAEKAYDWCKMKGKLLKDYRAFLRNWLRNHVEYAKVKKDKEDNVYAGIQFDNVTDVNN